MKSILALAVFVTLAAVSYTAVINGTPRANLIVGGVGIGDRLLHRSYVYKPWIANTVQYQDVVYRGNATNRVTAIQATEVGVSQWATAYIMSGGIGYNNVTIRFMSARGRGYYYLLDIWGR